MGKELPGSIEGKLVGVSYNYLNRNFESSELSIKVKMIDAEYKRFDYPVKFYGFVPESFIGKNIQLYQRHDKDKKTLYQGIFPRRNPNKRIDSIVEDFSDD